MANDNTEQKNGNYYSWNILNDNRAIKKADKSVFRHHGSGIPKETMWYWKAEHLKKGEQIDLFLYFAGKKYLARIKLGLNGRMKISWLSDLDKALKQGSSYNIDEDIYPTLLFTKKEEENTYFLEVINGDVCFNHHKDSNSKTDENTNEPIYKPQFEGRRQYITLSKPERSPANRKLCIQYHGLLCSACGFDFEKVYGEQGKDFIQVHHIVPLSTYLEEKKVDPINDLFPLCSNCHSMVHRKKNEVLLIEDLKTIIAPWYLSILSTIDEK